MLQLGKQVGKRGPGGLLIAGLAAFAYYKYSKMSPDQRKDLVTNLKEKGKKLFGQFIPSSQGNSNQDNSANGQRFNESNTFGG